MSKLRILQFDRAIENSKTQLWNELHYSYDFLNRPAWIMLGQFDSLVSYAEDCTEGVLKTIKKTNQTLSPMSTKTFRRLLYLWPTNPEQDESLWNAEEYNYMSVVRIHLGPAKAKSDTENFVSALKEGVLRQVQRYCIYKSIELSDMVIVIQTEKMSEILAFSKELQKRKEIAKSFTYLGLKLNKVFDKTFLQQPTSAEDIIPYISMHLSIRSGSDMANVSKLFKKYFKGLKSYATSGIDDFVLVAQNTDAKNLFLLYNTWISKGVKLNFSNICTQVGSELKTWGKGVPNLQLAKKCETLANEFLKKTSGQSVELQDGKLPNWVGALRNLLNSLVYIGATPELDEFVYLILPSAEAFISNINDQDIGSERIKAKAKRFIQDWNYLEENIMRSEEQFAHRPEIRPTIFDTPAVILEYLTAFLSECAKVLQQGDSDQDKKKTVSFLLMPSFRKFVSAEELFDNFCHEKGLVLVDVPFSMLYDLDRTLIVLCHEASHFVGEECREREERYRHYLTAAAAIVSKNVFNSQNPGLMDAIIKQAEEFMLQELKVDPKLITISQTERQLEQYLDALMGFSKSKETDMILRNREMFAIKYPELLRRTLQSQDYSPDEPVTLPEKNGDLVYTINSICKPLIRDIATLFRESYADLCMGFLLSPDPVDFIYEIYWSFNDERLSDALWDFCAARIALYFSVRKQSLPSFDALKAFGVTKDWYDLISQMIECCNKNSLSETLKELSFPMDAVLQANEYLNKCKVKLEQHCATKRDELKKYIAKDVEFDGNNVFYSLIDKYREGFLRESD